MSRHPLGSRRSDGAGLLKSGHSRLTIASKRGDAVSRKPKQWLLGSLCEWTRIWLASLECPMTWFNVS